MTGFRCNTDYLLWKVNLWKGEVLQEQWSSICHVHIFQIKKDYKDSNLIHIQLLGYYHPKVDGLKTRKNKHIFLINSCPSRKFPLPGASRHPWPNRLHRRPKGLWQMLLDGLCWFRFLRYKRNILASWDNICLSTEQIHP